VWQGLIPLLYEYSTQPAILKEEMCNLSKKFIFCILQPEKPQKRAACTADGSNGWDIGKLPVLL
jgi:hypothetical protein